MKRKLYFNNKQFIKTNPNNDIRNIETLKQKNFLKDKSKEEYDNELAKVYEINTHGKFTVIVRSSFLRLHIHPTTNTNPCYSYDLSSICDSEVFLQSNLNRNNYLDRDKKRKKWELLYEKLRKLIMKNRESIKHDMPSTFIVHTCMFN